ncbi:MAG: glycoside hydrolase family 28 protein [Halobacteriales archaeon]
MHESVTEFGAVGDGRTRDTGAIQAAVDACAESGGGTAYVPPGNYLIGTIELRSHVTLHLAAGATLHGSPDIEDYRSGDAPKSALVLAVDAENVAVTGRGTVHGNGTAFMDMESVIDPADDPATDRFAHEARQGEDFLDSGDGIGDGPVDPLERPDRLFMFHRCEDVLVGGITVRESPNWTLHLLGCEEVDVRGIDMRNEVLIPNSDGINPENCRNVHVSDCTVVTGDDAICPKASGAYDVDPGLANLTVTNCTLVSRSSAVKFGSSTAHDMRDCTFSNLVIRDSNRGLGIQHRDGGDIENVLFRNVLIDTRLHTGNWWGQAEPIYVTSVPRREGQDLGTVRNVRFGNILARGESGVLVYGSEASAIENLRFSDVRIELENSPKAGVRGGNVDLRPTATRTPLFEHDVPGLYARHVDGLDVEGFEVAWPGDAEAYFSHGLEIEAFDRVSISGFEGRGEDGAAIALRDGTDVSVRHSRAAPRTGTFLALSGTADERLFVGNDLADADAAIAGSEEFSKAANHFE